MRRNHFDAVAAQLLIQWIAVVSAIADEVLWLGSDHVEVETELNQTHFVVVGRMRTDRERQAMAIHNRHDFQALSALRRISAPPPLAIAKVASMKHSSSFSAPRSRSSLAMSVKTCRRISLRHHVWKRRCTVL